MEENTMKDFLTDAEMEAQTKAPVKDFISDKEMEGLMSKSNPAGQDKSIPQAIADGYKNVTETVADYSTIAAKNAPFAGAIDKLASSSYAGAQSVGDLFRDEENQKSFDQHYDEDQKSRRELEAYMEKRSPTATKFGAVQGALTSIAAPNPFSKTTGLTGVAGRVVGNSALSAAEQGFNGEGVFDLDAAKQAATLSGGIQSAVETIPVIGKAVKPIKAAIGKSSQKLAKGLDRISDWTTLKAGGAMTADNRALRHQNKTEEVAKYMRDKGIVSFGSTVNNAIERSAPLQKEAKSQISESLKALDQYAGPKGKGVDLNSAAKKIRDELIEPMKSGPRESKKIAAQLEEELDDLLSRSDPLDPHDAMSFTDANKLKNKYYDLIQDYGKEKSPYIEGMKKFAGIFNKSMEESADKVAKGANDPELYTIWKQAKKDFGNAETVSEMANKRADQLKQNNPFGLTDYAVGGAALAGSAASDDPLSTAMATLPLALANRAFRTRGMAATAISANKISGLLKKAPAIAAKYGNILQRAGEQGNKNLAITHFMLMNKDPEYRQVMEENGE